MKTIQFLLISALFLLLAGSCSDLESTFSTYSDIPEKIYLGKVDSLSGYGGIGRVKLTWFVNADPKIEQTVIYWNFRKDSVVKEFHRTSPGWQKDSITIDLAAGNYTFEAITRNSAGLYSVWETTSAISYGTDLRENLRERGTQDLSITEFNTETNTNTITITWADADPLNVYSEVSYTQKSTGERKTIYVTSEKDITQQTKTVLEDVSNELFGENTGLDIVCYYIPEKGAIDTIDSQVFTEQIVSYLSNGSRVQYNAAGAQTTQASWNNNYAKTLQKVGDGIYYCNLIAGFGANTVSLFRLEIDPNTYAVNISGCYTNTAWPVYNTPGQESSYDPLTRELTLKYTAITSASGDYTEVVETITPRY